MKHLAIPQATQKMAARFWSKVDILIPAVTPSPCWIWSGRSRSERGYGHFSIGRGVNFRANRIAYYLSRSVDPGDAIVCHSCDNPPCCNPDHLHLGTNLTNSQEMAIRGRSAKGDRNAARLYPEKWKRGDDHWTRDPLRKDKLNSPKGDKHPNAKLSSESVLEIRRLYATQGYKQNKLAVMFGVSNMLICRIINRSLWNHI